MSLKMSQIAAFGMAVLASSASLARGDGGDGAAAGKPVESPLHFAISLLGQQIPGPIPLKGWQAVLLVILVANFIISATAGRGPSVVASHILVKEKRVVDGIKKKLDQLAPGESVVEAFKAAAAESSICPSRRNGGSLGAFTPNQMVPAFDRYCFDKESKVGEVSKPVQTHFGWHRRLRTERELTLIATELELTKKMLARARRCAPPHARGIVILLQERTAADGKVEKMGQTGEGDESKKES